MHRLAPIAGLGAFALLAVAGCASDSSNDAPSAAPEASPSDSAEMAPAASMAMITLADGTELTSPVECVLEPHTFEDQPLTLRATVDPLDGNPRFNVAVADDGASFTGAIITWDEFTDETFTAVVVAWGGGEPFGTEFTATSDGTSISGSGTLVEGGPDGLTRASQEAELEVTCA